ncbi:hypothetical protein [Methylobacter sp. S3L5C]|uniref:hypothetical protein n=1 Tax=Methylobacter sp. S3L5C TaxID=2839024 RepID=UPI001FABE509|nr:hypothetical protein [Methylobacter sp. S3L5C]UOA07474.1 hypothetical protein KKZ03_14515 [Methylobacter sp. S3L5C]
MTEDKNDTIKKLGEEDQEFKRFANRGNKLKWTWFIGVFVMVVSLLYGDTAQLFLAVFAAVYIAITTMNYFKSTRFC